MGLSYVTYEYSVIGDRRCLKRLSNSHLVSKTLQ